MDVFFSNNGYIGRIKADTELKENTKKYVLQALAGKVPPGNKKSWSKVFKTGFLGNKLLAVAVATAVGLIMNGRN